MAQSNRRSNRRQQNKRQSNKRQQNKRQSNKRQQNRRQNRRQNGGDGQMGHTVMTESYYGRPTLGFGELQNAPQTQEQVDAMRGGDAVAATGHWNQAQTGWENAKTSCEQSLPGDVKLGGRRQNRRKSNKKQSNKRQQNRKSNRKQQNRRRSNRRQ